MRTSSLLFCCVVLFGITLQAQIGGVSGSKLTVPDAGTISQGFFEFEPSFAVSSYENFFSDEWSVQKLSRYHLRSSLQFRVSLGITEGVEVGTSFLSNINEVSIGSKITVKQTENYTIAFMPGILLPASNGSENDTVSTPLCYGYSAGAVTSVILSPKSNADILLSATYHTNDTDKDFLLCYGVAYGHYLTQKLFAVAEITGTSAI